MKSYFWAISLFLYGCDLNQPRTSPHYDTAWAWPRNQWDGPPGSEGNPVYQGDIGLSLKTGYLTAGGVFNESNDTLYLDPEGDYRFIQIGAFPSEYSNYNLDLVRIRFTSNRTEWIWAEPSETYIFATQEECQAAGYYCDPVIAGEGVSGIFDAGTGEFSATINAHCTHLGLPYTYTVRAYAYDISTYSGYEEVRISETKSIDVNCEME